MRVIGDRERGSITVLIIGFTAIAMALIVAGIDVSKVFLAQRALSSAADAAAVEAAQGVDTDRIYDGPDLRCGDALPLDPGKAARLAQESIEQHSPDLARSFQRVDPPVTTVDGRTVMVAMRGEVRVPFGRVLSFLGIANDGGAVPVREAAHATSPIAGSAATCAHLAASTRERTPRLPSRPTSTLSPRSVDAAGQQEPFRTGASDAWSLLSSARQGVSYPPEAPEVVCVAGALTLAEVAGAIAVRGFPSSCRITARWLEAGCAPEASLVDTPAATGCAAAHDTEAVASAPISALTAGTATLPARLILTPSFTLLRMGRPTERTLTAG